jgi:hypothetical protein
MLEVLPMGQPACQPACQSPQVCLTVLVPETLEERVVDWLISHPDWQVEFSVHRVAARGPLVRLALNDERVQGFAQRVELKLIIERCQLAALLAEVQSLLAGLEGGYWVLPVERFGDFAKASTPVEVRA